MSKIRAFIAISISSDIKQELAALIDKLKTSGADVKWVNPENIHLTLKFLGYISPEKIEEVKKVLDGIKSKFTPFKITFSGVGAFPKLSYPRVIWVGMQNGKDDAKRIYELLEAGLEKTGFKKEERAFSAHLTIGRVRSGKNRQDLKSAIENLKFSPEKTQTVEHLTLFKSALTPKGPIYTPLHKASFSIAAIR